MLQWFEEKAHGCSRGMNPTAGKTVIDLTIISHDTESEVRIRTLYGGN